jgi:hypothetical protein
MVETTVSVLFQDSFNIDKCSPALMSPCLFPTFRLEGNDGVDVRSPKEVLERWKQDCVCAAQHGWRGAK